MPSLYELSEDFRKMVGQLEELSESDIDPEVFQDTLDSLKAPMETKVENIIKYMKSLEALADAKKLEAKRLSDSASANLKKAEWFKQYVAENLQKTGINKLQAGIFSLGFRKGSEAVKIDESKLPDYSDAPHLYKHKIEFLGKTDLKKLIQEGQAIPGVKIVRNPDTLTIQ